MSVVLSNTRGVRMKIWFHDLRWETWCYSATMPCAMWVLNLCIFPKCSGFTQLPLKWSEKYLTYQGIQIGYSGSLALLLKTKVSKTKVCVNQKRFSRMDTRKSELMMLMVSTKPVLAQWCEYKAKFWGTVLCFFCHHVPQSS